MLNLNQVLSSHTIAVMETLEGCNVEELTYRLSALFGTTPEQPELQNASTRSEAWLCHYPPMLQACHVQDILGVCKVTAYNIMHHKDCPTFKFGRRVIVPRDAFWEFVMDHRGENLW